MHNSSLQPRGQVNRSRFGFAPFHCQIAPKRVKFGDFTAHNGSPGPVSLQNGCVRHVDTCFKQQKTSGVPWYAKTLSETDQSEPFVGTTKAIVRFLEQRDRRLPFFLSELMDVSALAGHDQQAKQPTPLAEGPIPLKSCNLIAFSLSSSCFSLG